jgi:hypothetical protein
MIPNTLTVERSKPDTILTASWQGPGYLIQLESRGRIVELTTEEGRRLYTWLGLCLGPVTRE